MKKVLLYYNFSYPISGGEYLPLALLSELQKTCEVTLACDLASGLERAMGLFDMPLDMSRLSVVQLMPDGYHPSRHTPLLSLRRSWKLKRLARKADVCISAGNIIDFGKPAHHFMTIIDYGDPAFTAYARGQAPGKASPMSRLKRFVFNSLLRRILGLRSKRRIIADMSERIYPNSRYLDRLMRSFYGDFNGEVFFPPTMFEPGTDPLDKDARQVVFIGRISPEKDIVGIIEIVERARALSGQDLRLCIAGPTDRDTAYIRALKKLAQERPWMSLPGAAFGEAKDRLLRSSTYAVHTGTIETFGISVAEYIKAGNIALVPQDGGSREVVDSPDLTYRTREEAAQILARLLQDAPFRERQLRHCGERARFFSRKAYCERQSDLLRRILQDGPASSAP